MASSGLSVRTRQLIFWATVALALASNCWFGWLVIVGDRTAGRGYACLASLLTILAHVVLMPAIVAPEDYFLLVPRGLRWQHLLTCAFLVLQAAQPLTETGKLCSRTEFPLVVCRIWIAASTLYLVIQARLGKLAVWSLIRLTLGLTAVSTFLSNELMGALRDGFVRERSLYLFMLTNAFLAGTCTQSFRTVLREMLLAVPLGVLQKGEYERLSTDKGSPPRRRSEKNGSCRSCSSKSDSEMAEINAIFGADPIDDDIISKLSDSPTLGVRGSSSNRFDSFRLLPQFYAEQHHDGVTYIEDPSQRLRYQLMVKDGKLIDTSTGAPLCPGAAKEGMYTMDTSGNVYVCFDHPKTFHHSSFVAGKPVAAAGTITVCDGRLRAISNESGHYMPPPSTLTCAMERLAELGVAGLQSVQLDIVTRSAYDAPAAGAGRVEVGTLRSRAAAESPVGAAAEDCNEEYGS